MATEIIEKNLERIKKLLIELEQFLIAPFEDFKKNEVLILASERKFQLIVDLASDINAQILIERGRPTPDSYRQSFLDLAKEGIIDKELAEKLALTARLRNILVHEYDFEEDYEKFYQAAKVSLPAYQQYLREIYKNL